MGLFSFESEMKPFLKWAGGKSGLLSQITPYFPTFERYVEPFIGGGAVFFALKQTVSALINDSNTELIDLYTMIRDASDELMTELDRLEERYSEKFYYELRGSIPKDRIKRAARMIFLNKTGFNGLYRLNLRGVFNVPFGKRSICPGLYDRNNLIAVSKRLQYTDIHNRDFEEVLETTGPGDFVYCDPPYEPLSMTSSFNSYTAGGFSRREQTRLRDVCERAAHRGAVIAISNSSAAFIQNLYANWDVKIVSAKRHINSKGDLRGSINEVLAMRGGECRTKLINRSILGVRADKSVIRDPDVRA